MMTPLDKVFMLQVDERLDFRTISRIFQSGFSRIPVRQPDPVLNPSTS